MQAWNTVGLSVAWSSIKILRWRVGKVCRGLSLTTQMSVVPRQLCSLFLGARPCGLHAV